MQKIKLISQEENNILQNAIYKARQSLSTKNGLDPTEKTVTYLHFIYWPQFIAENHILYIVNTNF